ncbi:MAG: lysozyme [Micromonosporaceae bacterium]
MAQDSTLRPRRGTGAPHPRGRRWRTAGLGLIALSIVSFASIGGLHFPSAAADQTVRGIDVSHWQGPIDWNGVRASGMAFAYLKATEGVGYRDSRFGENYTNSYRVGILRGAYHYALPDRSSGAAQAEFFIANGGAWSADGKTMPGMLDLEWNPYGGDCYGMSQPQMREWIRGFMTRYHERTGRWAVIYTNIHWWNPCVGDFREFSDKAPLWIARYNSSPGAIPPGWPTWSFWQYTSKGQVSGVAGHVDMNEFDGSYERLKMLALGS